RLRDRGRPDRRRWRVAGARRLFRAVGNDRAGDGGYDRRRRLRDRVGLLGARERATGSNVPRWVRGLCTMNGKKMRANAIAWLLALACAGAVQAQVPQLPDFTYQGRLTQNGMPANGEYDLEFALYDAETGGNEIGTAQSEPGYPDRKSVV